METRTRKRKGQTIIEAVLAISVLTVGFLGIMALLSRSLFLSRVTSNELTATYLASEGIEIVKNIVDHDIYAGPPGWGSSFGGGGDFAPDYTTCTSGIGSCSVGSLTPTSCPGNQLMLDPATHLYSYTGSVATPFSRCVRITIVSANEIQVNSMVTWSTGPLTSQSINLEDHFYNWHP